MRMGVLTRHLIRAHVGPFLFALVAVTGLIFLNAVALQIQGLVGKGLPWTIVLEFLVLSLPHTVALSLPMAVLVAVLYAFSDLTTSNEITAMAAGGIRPSRLLVPLMGMGLVATMIMLYFNNTVLPEANHRLKNLMVDISRKSPTFELREDVLNPIRTDNDRVKYYLAASQIDPTTNTLRDVTIFDASDPLRKRTTHAARGTMMFNAARTDLYLTLYDGVVREVKNDGKGGFQRTYFKKQVVPMRGVGTKLDTDLNASQRGEREMDFAMLFQAIAANRVELDSVRVQSRRNSERALAMALKSTRPVANAPRQSPQQSELARLRRQVISSPKESLLSIDATTRDAAVTQRTLAQRVRSIHDRINRYQVQIYKMWAIAFACLVFTFVGPQLALRFPRGGVGMVIAASTSIFSVYWVGLIAGESLADKSLGSPFFTMWIPNIVFTIVGLFMLPHMASIGSTARGSVWDEIGYRIRSAFGRVFRRQATGAAG